MPFRPTKIQITQTPRAIRILGSEKLDCRKSLPNISQTWIEEEVKRTHSLVKKISSYELTEADLIPQDHYAEEDFAFDVPGARMNKGDRKVQDTSWPKTSTPKDWVMHMAITFKSMTKLSAPLSVALASFGAGSVSVDDVKKTLKKNGTCILRARFRRGSWGETIIDRYVIGGTDDE